MDKHIVSGLRHLPRYRHPSAGSQVRPRQLLVSTFLTTTPVDREEKRRYQTADKNTTCSVPGGKGVTPGLGRERAGRPATNRSKMDA